MDEPGFRVETGVMPLPYEVSPVRQGKWVSSHSSDHLLLLLCCFPFVVLLII